jgi:hypothetical protein
MANTDGAVASIRLTGPQVKEFSDAVLGAYRDFDELKMSVRFGLDEQLNQIVVTPSVLPTQVYQLIEWAESRDRVLELADVLHKYVPQNRRLADFYRSVSGTESLEKIVVQNPQLFSDPDGWRRSMAARELTVCRVENPEGQAVGTGFLVGPDLLLTNQHVRRDALFDSQAASARFRFDFRVKADGTMEGGKLVGLKLNGNAQDKPWHVANSPVDQLDFALVRLDRRIGDEAAATFLTPREGAGSRLRAPAPIRTTPFSSSSIRRESPSRWPTAACSSRAGIGSNTRSIR